MKIVGILFCNREKSIGIIFKVHYYQSVLQFSNETVKDDFISIIGLLYLYYIDFRLKRRFITISIGHSSNRDLNIVFHCQTSKDITSRDYVFFCIVIESNQERFYTYSTVFGDHLTETRDFYTLLYPSSVHYVFIWNAHL